MIYKKRGFLPYHQPLLGREEEKEVIDTLRSGWITTGPRTKKFEELFARYIGCNHAIGLNSCTAGLHLALVASGIGDGDEVITSPVTFPATANVIVHQRARPVFIDIDRNTLNMEPSNIEEKITERTKAIIPVHFAGHPCEMDAIMKIAKKYKLIVIEDAAHALEAEYKRKKIGTIGTFTAFSFYATKNITTGEGGMLTTDNNELSEKARIFSLHGISKDAWKRYSPEGYIHWETLYPGYKYNMFDIQAAIGIHQFPKMESFWKKRKKYTEMYDEAFSSVEEVAFLKRKEYVKPSFHLYVILLNLEKIRISRDEFLNEIQSEGVGVGIHFRSLHLHPYYKEKFGFKKGDYPNAEYVSERIISLPLYPKMKEEDIKFVIRVVKKLIKKHRIKR